MQITIQNKRCLPRINLRTALRYQIRGKAEFNNAISDNVSLGGIGFINDKFINPKALVMLEFNVLSRMLRPIGRIAWAANLPHSNRYRIGIEFLELPLEEKSYLADYINIQTNKI